MGDWTNYGSKMGFQKFAPMTLHDMKFNVLGMLVGFILSWGVRRLFDGRRSQTAEEPRREYK